MARFYPNGSAGPAVLPPYLIVTNDGAWAYDNVEDVREASRQLYLNHVSFRMLQAAS